MVRVARRMTISHLNTSDTCTRFEDRCSIKIVHWINIIQ